MQIIETIEELDIKIEECNEASNTSDDAMRALFDTFRMKYPDYIPEDPFSAEFYDSQMQLYRDLTGKNYSNDAERTPFDIENAVIRPFPFYTESCTTSGEYFEAIGFLLRTMALPPKQRIVEFGAGWGFTSIWMAKLGHKVTVVEIDPNFCELIRRRAEIEHVEIEIINDDFLWISNSDREFDAAIFFECFHHCSNHMGLLRGLHRSVTEGGSIFIAAEPITKDFPAPWGIRLDGNSLWAARNFGWLELGFQEGYFVEALQRTGWLGRRHSIGDHGMMVVWHARKRDAVGLTMNANDKRLFTEIGTKQEAVIVLPGGISGTGLFGPYVDMPRGRYIARISFDRRYAIKGTATLDVCGSVGTKVVAKANINSKEIMENNMAAELPFDIIDDVSQIEIRLFCPKEFTGAISVVEIRTLKDPRRFT